MFVVSLIARTLDPATVDSLRNAWGGGGVLWLSPIEAAEFEIGAMPSNRWQVWSDLQARGVDLVVQASGDRRKRVLIADMDSTMIGQECLDELAEVAGFGDQVKAITARAMNGELDFEAAIDERVALLEGVSTDVIGQVLAERITYTDGGAVLLRTMRAHGAYCALVSGGFTQFTEAVGNGLGFDMNRANVLLHAGGVLTGRVQKPVLGREAKVAALEELITRFDVSDADVLAVGDGANDLGMLTRAGLGVALHAKPAVQEACDVRINHCDLTALLYLQGYTRAQFV